MTTYEKVASRRDGSRRLAAARLRYAVLKTLHTALDSSSLTQSALAQRLGIRKSAVSQVLRGDGNVRINTLAEYAHELGFEVHVELRPEGTARRAAQNFAPEFDLHWIDSEHISIARRSAPAITSTRQYFAGRVA